MAFEIDNEVRRLIDEAHDLALDILTENRDRLKEWGGVLAEKETLDKAAVEELFADVRKRPQRDPSQRAAALGVSRVALHRQQGHEGGPPSGLRG